MHPPRFSYGSGPAPSPPQPSPSNAAPRAFQTDRLYSPSQPTRFDARQQHSTGRSSGAPPHPGTTHTTTTTTTTTAPATVMAASTPPLTFRSAPFRPSTADSRDRFTLSGARPENGMASPLNHYDYSKAGTSNNSNSNSSGAGWARRGDEVHGVSRPHERFAAEADTTPWTTKATTLLPTLSRLSPYTRNPAPTSTSANTTSTASAGSVHRASARANSTTPSSTAAAGPASLLPPSTGSALHYGSGGRAVSLPQNTSAVPPSPPPPAPSISGSETWPSSRFQDELPAAMPGHFDEGPRVSRPSSSGAAAAIGAARPRGPAVAAVPIAAQLQLSHFAVRDLDLQAVDTAAGHVLLRGTFGDATDVFCTDAVWPTPEQNWKRNRQQSDAAQTFTAAWPETTVSEAVHLPFAPSHPPPPQQQQSDAPSRTFVCECYVTHTAPHAPPAKRSEMFVGRSQVAVEELVEAASAAATATSPSPLQAMAGVPAEVVLREDGGAVVGRLCFAVTLLPLPSRTVRLLNVAVLPDPMRTEEEEEEAEREGASAARHYRETDNINRSGSRRRSAVYEGELGLRLRPPTISASMADGPSSGSSVTTADFRTPAAVRWTALAPFSFCEAPIKSPNEDAEDLNDEQQQQQKHPHQTHRQPITSLVVGELYYCPPRQLTASQSRSSSMLSTAAAHAPVLLGTFSIPPLHSAASGSTTATPYASSTPGSLRAYRATPRRGGLASYSFQVPLRTSAEGGRWMAMGDCWVRGVVETWVEEADAEALAAVLASTPSAVLSSGPSTPPPAASTSVNLAGAAHPPSQAAAGARGGAAELLASSPSLTTSRSVAVNSGSFQQPPAQPQSCSQQEAREPTLLHHTPSRPTTQPANYSTSRSAVSLRLPTQLTPTPPPPSTTQPSALTTDQTPQEDVALQRVRERQEALIQRVEYRLSAVREQRQRLAAEMAANDAAAAAEEGAILEEFGVVEAQQGEAEAACREATAQLVELEQLHADRAADHDAYLAEQARALDDVARERAEAMELRAQLEALQAQMRAHMAAEQQRYAARVEHTRAAMQRVEANTRWLTEVEARIAAAESAPS